MPKKMFFFGLLQRREVTVPSLKGSLLLAAMFGAIFFGIIHTLHSFLSPISLIGGDVLVVEGWIPDYSQREAMAIFRTGKYQRLITTGGPVPLGMPYSSFGNHAAMAAFTLKEMGLGEDSIVAVPSPYSVKDRTYTEGVALHAWLKSNSLVVHSLDLFTFSAHGRRSRYLYQRALGDEIKIGVYSAKDIGYDAKLWWKSSIGVRRVIDEAIAYLYSITFFRPLKE
jgi:hypothetical protein